MGHQPLSTGDSDRDRLPVPPAPGERPLFAPLQHAAKKFRGGNAGAFLVFWCALFVLYWPAARCGWVSDTLGWLESVRNQSFSDYIHRSHFGVRSFYQTTQFVTWCLYQLFGANRWAWHLLHISLHALNCALLFALLRGLLGDGGIKQGRRWAFAAAALFCCSPYVSEVIVWEASFHYLQGLFFILSILLLLRRFLNTPRRAFAWAAGGIFGLSLFSLELFYLTPLFTASLLFHYRRAFGYDAAIVRRAARFFLLPQAVLFLLHLALVRAVYGTASARLGDALLQMPVTYYAVKPPDYCFHLLGGRFLPQAVRSAVHQAFCTYTGAGIFYSILLAGLLYIVVRYRRMAPLAQLTGLALCWLLAAMALVTPMWFPERLLILGDRYMYIMLPFFFMVVVLLMRRSKRRWLPTVMIVSVLALQCGATRYLSGLWAAGQALTDTLQRGFQPPAGRIVLLLNNPQSLRGAPMIGAGADGELKLMHNLLYDGPPIKGAIADVLAFDAAETSDRVLVTVESDTTMLVALLRPGGRWWYGSDYARSYGTPDYSVELISPRAYRLTLRGDPGRFCLMYQQAGTWKTIDVTQR